MSYLLDSTGKKMKRTSPGRSRINTVHLGVISEKHQKSGRIKNPTTVHVE